MIKMAALSWYICQSFKYHSIIALQKLWDARFEVLGNASPSPPSSPPGNNNNVNNNKGKQQPQLAPLTKSNIDPKRGYEGDIIARRKRN